MPEPSADQAKRETCSKEIDLSIDESDPFVHINLSGLAYLALGHFAALPVLLKKHAVPGLHIMPDRVATTSWVDSI